MSSLNKAQIIGRLGQDPETRYTQSGSAVTNISVATSEKWKDKETGEQKEKTEWHRIVAFGKLAEIMGEHLRKASQVYIEGKIQTRKWQDQEGNDRYSTEIVASQLVMLGGRSGAPDQGQQQSAPATQQTMVDDDIPF